MIGKQLGSLGDDIAAEDLLPGGDQAMWAWKILQGFSLKPGL